MNSDAEECQHAKQDPSVSAARLVADLPAMQRLYDLHARLANEADLTAALREILAAACEFTGTARGCVQLLSGDGERLEMVAHQGYPPGSAFTEHFRFQGSLPACDAVRRQEQRLIIEDVEAFPPLAGTRDLEVARADGIRATQSTPMISRRGELVGVLNNQFPQPHRPSEDELRLIDLLAWTAADFVTRHRTDLALRQSEEQFRSFVAASADTVYKMSADWSEMRYLEGKQFLADTSDPSRTWLEKYIPVEDRSAVLTAIQEAIRDRHPFELEHRVVRADNTVGWTSSRAIPLLDAHGEINEWIGAARDITERKRAERTQAFFLKVSDALRPLTDPVAIQAAACRLLGEHLGADRAYYVAVDEAAGITRVERDYLRGDSPSLVGQYRMADFGWIIPHMRRGELLVIPDVAASPLVPAADQPFMAAVQVAAHVNAPLVKNGVLVGALCVTERTPRVWTAAEAELVRETAERIWAAVERAHAEEALARSEEKYRTLFNSVDEGFCIFELLFDGAGQAVDWIYTEANPAFEKLTGYHDPVGRRISYFQPDFERSWFERFAQVARTGEPTRFVQYTAAMGVWYDVYAHRVGQPGGNRISLLFTDVTASKRREANLAFLAEASQDLARLTHIDETMDRLGAKIGAYFHVSRCAFCRVDEGGQTITVTHEWKLADLPSLKGIYRLDEYYTEESQRAYEAGETFVVRDVDGDMRLNAAQMKALDIRAFVRVPLVRDGVSRFSLNVYDATPREWREDELELLHELTSRIGTRLERARAEEALRESEARTRALAENLPGGAAFIFDRQLRYVLADGEALRATGFQSADFLGKTSAEALGEALATYYVPHLRAALAGEPFVHEHSSHEATFISRGAPLREPASGEITGVVVISYDITERKRAEEALRASLEEREALLKELHHRVKNNLQVITSLLEMQARQVHDPTAVAALAESRHRITAIASIHELLYQEGTFSRVELGTYARELVPRLVSFYHAQDRIKTSFVGEEVLVDLDCAVPCGLLLNELVSNTCKHAFPPPGAGTLTITLTQDGTTIRLDVRDDGVGLPAGLDPRKSPTLGLQLVGLLAKQLGGSVVFHPGGGTHAEVRVPRGSERCGM